MEARLGKVMDKKIAFYLLSRMIKLLSVSASVILMNYTEDILQILHILEVALLELILIVTQILINALHLDIILNNQHYLLNI